MRAERNQAGSRGAGTAAGVSTSRPCSLVGHACGSFPSRQWRQGGGGNQITAVLDRRRLISGKYRTPGIRALRQRGCNWHGAWNGEQRPRTILAGPKRCSNGCAATGPGSRRRSPCCGCCPHPSRHSTRKVSRPRYLPESTKAFWRAQLVRGAALAPEQVEECGRFFEAVLRMVGALERVGAGLIAGSDSGNAHCSGFRSL